MKKKNKYGLSRHIPESIAREIRIRSKFGCVICRSAIYQYEHISPPFSEAKEHNPNNMCLLCGRCHDKVTKRQISKETVRNAYEQTQSENEIRRPFDDLVLSGKTMTVCLGSSVFHGASTLIEVDGNSVLSIEPPEVGAAFPTLTGHFSDRSGKEIFRIIKNVWYGPFNPWDMTIVGNVVTIRSAPKEVALKLIIEPPDRIVVEHLDMKCGDAFLRFRKDTLEVGKRVPRVEYLVGIESFICHTPDIGIKIDSRNINNPKFEEVKIHGDNGIIIEGMGISLGVRPNGMTIRKFYLEMATKTYTKRLTFPLVNDLKGHIQMLPPRL